MNHAHRCNWTIGPGEETVRKPQDRRQRILATAAELFARKGVAATTVRQIADQVGILSGSLYHHFESKEAIVDEILSAYLTDLRNRYRQLPPSRTDPRTRLRHLVRTSLEAVQTHPHATEICQNEANYLRATERFGYLRSGAREVQSIWVEAISAGVDEGVFRADLDPTMCYRLIRDTIGLSVRWFRPTRDYPVERFAEECSTLFLNGLAGR
jgi:AcrR family transcriptional regulator